VRFGAEYRRRGVGGCFNSNKQYNSHLPLSQRKADYSRIKQPRCWAPPSIQRSALDLMVLSSCVTSEDALRKHRTLRSFQISQATNAKRVSAPFWRSPCQRNLQRSHHARRVSSPTQDASAPSTESMVHQTWRENEQEATIWSIVSGSWSQR
jgi:hypothetical protein